MKYFILITVFLFSFYVFGGILPTSRGGTGANITPSANSIVTSTSSGFALSTHITLGAGTTVSGGAPLVIPSGSSIATPINGAIVNDGTHLWWVDSSLGWHRLDN